MSADLVGSTAFKASSVNAKPTEESPSPVWVAAFRSFYQNFPGYIRRAYDAEVATRGLEECPEADGYPHVWKTVGDEIIFCNRIRSVDHVAASVASFLRALEQYSITLEESGSPLRLKGSGWLAAFPAPNVSIRIFSKQKSASENLQPEASENEEAFELAADEAPEKFDFLGKGIDTGFRIAKNASEDRFVTSVQLGYILAQAGAKRRFQYSFGFHGREALKGVNDGIPYPIVSVDTERSDLKLELKSREAALTGAGSVSPQALRDYLRTFMDVAKIELPCLPHHGQSWKDKLPETYLIYKAAWEKNLEKDDENLRQIADEPIGNMSAAIGGIKVLSEFLDRYSNLRNREGGSAIARPKDADADVEDHNSDNPAPEVPLEPEATDGQERK